MAFDIFDLAAKISLDSSELEEGLQKTQGSLSAGAVAMGNLASNAISTALSKTVDFAKSSIKAGADFDSAMAQVAATSGVTMDELNNNIVTVGDFTGSLRDFAQQEGATTAFSATQAAEALNYMALAGYSATTSVQMLPNVLNLAAAGGMELADASNMVTDAQSALGLTLDETNVMVDQMAKASSTTNTSVSQLGEAILTVGGTAKSMKGGTEELSAVLGVLADNGIKGAEGGTHLRNMILSLSSPTDNASVALDKLGISLYDAQGNMRSLSDVFQDLNKSMEGMTDEQKTNTIATIFNKTDIKAVNALLGTNAEKWDKVYGAIDNAAGAAQQMADTQLDNLEGDVVKFQSALEGAQIAISDSLSPTLREFVQMGTEGLSKFTEWIDSSDALNEAIELIGEGLASVIDYGVQFTEWLASGSDGADAFMAALTGIAVAAGAYQVAMMAVQGVTNLVAGAQAALNAVMAANPIGIVVVAIAALVAALIYLYNNNETVRNGITAAWEGIKSAITAAIEGISAALTAISEFIASTWESITTTVSNAMTAIGEFIASTWESITTTVSNAMTTIGTAVLDGFTALVNNLTEPLTNMKTAISDAFTSVKDTAKGVIDSAITWGSDLIDNFVSGIKKGFDKVETAMSDLADVVRSHIHFSEPDVGPLSDFHTYAPDMMKQFAKGIDENLPLVEDSMNRMGNMVRGNMQFSTEGFEDNIPVDGMQNSLDGMVNGLSTTKVKGNNGNVVSTSDNYTFNIYQREGENDTEFARRIADIINSDVQRKRAVYA